jgi:hypothetical protein
VFILRTEMQHDGAARAVGEEFRDLSAVIADSGGGMETSGSKPGERTTPTETDNADFLVRSALRGVSDDGGNIEEGFVETDLRGDLHAARGIGGVVFEFDAGLNAVEERGSHGGETLAGVIIDERTDVAVDAEDFLDDDDGGSGGGGGLGGIGAEAVTVRGGQLNVGAHRRSLQFLVHS